MGKTFTLEEANRALVFVAPVLKEIQTIWVELMTFKENPQKSTNLTIREKLNRLKTCTGELAQVGCIVRDPVEGVIDFPSFYKDRPVFLCWHLGEEFNEYWHFAQEETKARRPVDEEFIAWNDKIPTAESSMV